MLYNTCKDAYVIHDKICTTGADASGNSFHLANCIDIILAIHAYC